MRVVLGLGLLRAWRRALALGAALLVFELLVGLTYASVDQNQIRQVVDSLPPALRALAAGSDVASPSGYVGLGFVHPVALTLLLALAVSMAAQPARDVEDGVAELVLSRPLAPWRWLAAQAGAMALLVADAAAAGVLGAAIAARTVDDLGGVSLPGLLLVGAQAWLLAMAVGAITLLAAARVRTGGRAVAVGAGFAVVSYAVNYLAEVWTLAEPLGRLSVFSDFRPADTLGAVAAVSPEAEGTQGGGLFFLGLGATFLLVWLAPTPSGRMGWAIWPAGALLVMGLLLAASFATVANLIFPVGLVLAGAFLLFRAFRPRSG